jgi:heptosyltransferase-3
MRILISRTDSIGDVVLTLPMAGLIKKHLPNAEIDFLGRTYTKAVIECSGHIREFINWDELEKKDEKSAISFVNELNYDVCIHVFPVREIARFIKNTNIKTRIGTKGRFYHWMNCNQMVRFSRRRSDLHESQLNMKLLQPLGIDEVPSTSEMAELAAFNSKYELKGGVENLIDSTKFNLIVHPKSKGSAVEWGLQNFSNLITKLPKDRYNIFITGTEAEGELIGNQMPFELTNVHNMIGKLSLQEFISFIEKTDGLVAASTGPLHLSGIMNKSAIGLYSPRRPIHPGRWAPLGQHSKALVFDQNCKKCGKHKACDCIKDITPEAVIKALE